MELSTFDQVVQYMEHFTNLEKKTDKYNNMLFTMNQSSQKIIIL